MLSKGIQRMLEHQKLQFGAQKLVLDGPKAEWPPHGAHFTRLKRFYQASGPGVLFPRHRCSGVRIQKTLQESVGSRIDHPQQVAYSGSTPVLVTQLTEESEVNWLESG